MITIKTSDKIVKIGEINGRKLNLICNFKATRLADEIEKLPYVHVLRMRSMDDENVEWGIGLEIGNKEVSKLKADLFYIIRRL